MTESPYLARLAAMGVTDVSAKALRRRREILHRRAGWLAATLAARRGRDDAWEIVETELEALLWALRALGLYREASYQHAQERARAKIARLKGTAP